MAEREDPDLVILDIFMPEKEGIETILDLRQTDPGLKVIVMSGGGVSGCFDYLRHAEYFGALRTFSKPFCVSEMVEAVEAVVPTA